MDDLFSFPFLIHKILWLILNRLIMKMSFLQSTFIIVMKLRFDLVWHYNLIQICLHA